MIFKVSRQQNNISISPLLCFINKLKSLNAFFGFCCILVTVMKTINTTEHISHSYQVNHQGTKTKENMVISECRQNPVDCKTMTTSLNTK